MAVAASMALASWLRAGVGASALQQADFHALAYYLATNAVTLVAIVAATTALIAWWRARASRVMVGLLAALTTTVVAAPAGPVAMLVALCGPAHTLSCGGFSFGAAYANFLSVIGGQAIAKVLAGSIAVMAVASVVSHVRRRTGRNERATLDEPVVIRSPGEALAVGVILVAVVVLAGHSVYGDLVTN